MRVLFVAAEVERDLIPLAQHAPRKFADKLKTLVQLIGAFCRVLRSSIKVGRGNHIYVVRGSPRVVSMHVPLFRPPLSLLRAYEVPTYLVFGTCWTFPFRVVLFRNIAAGTYLAYGICLASLFHVGLFRNNAAVHVERFEAPVHCCCSA